MACAPKPARKETLGVFEKYLTLWIAICIVVGLLVGRFVPQFGQFMDSLKFRQLSIPIGILLFFMMYPTVVGIRFSDIKQAARRPKPLMVTLIANWVIAPPRRVIMQRKGEEWFTNRYIPLVGKISIVALLTTLIVLFKVNSKLLRIQFMAAGKILLTTSRNPTLGIRTLCNELSRTMPSFVYVNRGKMSTDEVAEKALDHEADRVVIVDRWHGGPSVIKLFKVEELGLVSFPPVVHVVRIKLQREFEATRFKPAVSLVVGASGAPQKLLRFGSALSSFFCMPMKPIEKASESSETLMYLVQDDIGRVVITFMSEPEHVEIGPRIVASSLEWQVP